MSLALLGSACSTDGSRRTIARQITSRTDLIGGPGALGEIGDYLLANDRIRVIVQGAGYSRGFGIYGGSLIDADLVRPFDAGDSSGGKGYDHFSELFPAIFLKAMKPATIKAIEYSDGSAAVQVTGTGDEFVFIAKRIDDLLVDSSKLLFQNEYRLRPGKRYVEITTTVLNQGEDPVEFPGQGITQLSTKLTGFTMPVGDVILFGAGNDVFSEIAGFDLRFTLEALYQQAVALPKLPGLVTPFLATRGERVSYGFASGITDPNLSFVARTGYENANVDDMVVPFIASSFTGAYYGAAPSVLDPKKSFSFKKYFMVGSGDVASIRDTFHDIRGKKVGTFAGVVRELKSEVVQSNVSVVSFNAQGIPYNQHTTDDRGEFKGTYEPGQYTYRVVSDGRFTTDPVAFEVKEGQATYLDIYVKRPGLVSVRIHAEDGRLMPARCSLVGQYPASASGFDPKDFLYNYKWGEKQRPTDLIPDDPNDPSTREYVEQTLIANTGVLTAPVRPGSYRAVCSRGIEYDTSTQQITVQEGQLVQIDTMLHHVVNTDGWASGDYHMHSVNSVDSPMKLDDRIGHAAAEGLDVACSTDHNFVTDYTPSIQRLGLDTWIQGMVGLEMTTLEIGHFNGFPLNYNPGPITKGSFAWAGRPPADIFHDMRKLGKLGVDNMVIQVNHPRDTILGYFNDYHFNPDTGEVEESTSLLAPVGPEFGAANFTPAFDALEVFNGKRFELLHTYRVPDVLPPPPLPTDIPPAGTILRDKDGKVAFPGALEDWYVLLNKGVIYTATGNSDSHNSLDEPAYPRTYTPVSNDHPGGISEMEIVQDMKNQRALPTNGPFIRVSVDGRCHNQKGDDLARSGCGMGEVATVSGGMTTVKVTVDAAPWVQLDTVRFVRGGQVVATVHGDNASLQSLTQSVPVMNDTFITVEASGSKSLWPVLTPLEVPAIQVSDALNSIGGAFGINLNPFGNLRPDRTFITHAFGFTNPVFIDTNGNGVYDPPGVSQSALTAAKNAPRLGVRNEEDSLPALMKMFVLFDGHAH